MFNYSFNTSFTLQIYINYKKYLLYVTYGSAAHFPVV